MTLHTKTCRQCGVPKPLDDFYRHKQMLDGHLNICIPCVCKSVRDRRANNPSIQEYDRERSKLPHRKEQSRQTVKKYRAENPARYAANTAVGNALRDGRIQRSPCYFCGENKYVHAHHKDYSKPLEVTWLCVKCHRRLHALAPEHVHG